MGTQGDYMKEYGWEMINLDKETKHQLKVFCVGMRINYNEYIKRTFKPEIQKLIGKKK